MLATTVYNREDSNSARAAIRWESPERISSEQCNETTAETMYMRNNISQQSILRRRSPSLCRRRSPPTLPIGGGEGRPSSPLTLPPLEALTGNTLGVTGQKLTTSNQNLPRREEQRPMQDAEKDTYVLG